MAFPHHRFDRRLFEQPFTDAEVGWQQRFVALQPHAVYRIIRRPGMCPLFLMRDVPDAVAEADMDALDPAFDTPFPWPGVNPHSAMLWVHDVD